MRRFTLLLLFALLIASIQPMQTGTAAPSYQQTGLRVTEVLPADASVNIAADSVITVVFNRPVVPLSTSLDMDTLPHPLVIEPAIAGTSEWINTSIYVYRPAAVLPPNQTYRVTIPQGLTAADGSVLADAYTWMFQTAPAMIAEIRLGNEDTPFYNTGEDTRWLLELNVWVTFTQPVDQADVETNFYLRPQDEQLGTIPGTFRWTDDSKVMTFRPHRRLRLETTYITGIDLDGLRYPLTVYRGESSIRFTTAGPPRITGTSPANDATDASGSGLRLYFTTPIDASTLDGQVTVEPEPPRITGYDYGMNYLIDFPIELSTTYTVTLPEHIRDIYGNQVAGDRVYIFTTAPAPTSLRLNVPGALGFMNAYAPDTGLYVTARNLRRVDLDLFRVPLDQFVPLLMDDERLYSYTPEPNQRVRVWSQALQGDINTFTPQYVSLNNGNALGAGIYRLNYAYQNDRAERPSGWHMMMVLTANLTIKASVDGVLVWATDVQTGAPIPHVPIRIYQRGGGVIIGTTDADGILSVPTRRVNDMTRQWLVAVLDSDGHFGISTTRWADGIDPGMFGYTANFAPARHSVYAYTDRPIYRTDQTVYFRAVVREVDDAAYFPPSMAALPVQITDSRGNTVFSQELSLSEFGTLDGDFHIAADAPLGIYQIRVTIPSGFDQSGSEAAISFSVAQYRLPEFEVTATATPPEVAQNDSVRVLTESHYFFGAAVTDANVDYQVVARPYEFQYRGEGWYQFYDWGEEHEVRGYDRPLTQEGGQTDSQGRYLIEFPAQLIETDRSQVYTIEPTIADATDQSVSTRTQVIVHAGLVYVGGQPERYVGTTGEPMNINIITVDWDSEGVPAQTVDVEVIERRWNSVQEMDGSGRTTWTWEVENIPITTGQVITGADGRGMFTFTPPNGGYFQIKLKTRDSAGNEIRSAVYTWIADTAYVPWRPANNNRIDLIADQDRYEVGDTADILITSPFQGRHEALITVERGGILSYERITMESNTYIYHLPIDSSYIPNVYVGVMLVKAVDDTHPVAAFRMGVVQINVNTEQRELNVSISVDQERSQPNDEITFTVRITDYRGEPVSAEVGVALTDKASLSVLQIPPVLLMNHFYNGQGMGVRTGTALTMNTDYISQYIMDMIKGGGGGGGGANIFDLRDNFVDTPYWNAHLVTNAAGEATFTVTLPDNLTTWHVDARAISLGAEGVLLVGQNTHEIISTLPLIVRPVTPRFFVVDDVLTLGAVVNNNTPQDMTVDVEMLAQGVTIEGETRQQITIPADSAARVDWVVRVNDVDGVDLTFTAREVNGVYTDAARPVVGRESDQVIPVYRYIVPETVGTSGVLRAGETRTEVIALPDEIVGGELTVQIQPSLAAVTLDGLTYLRNFEHQCIEQTVSRFLPNMMTYAALERLGVEDAVLQSQLEQSVNQALQQLVNWQNVDGGWGWFSGEESSPLTTAYALMALSEARAQSFPIAVDLIERAQRFLRTTFVVPGITLEAWHLNRQAFVLYALARSGTPDIARTSNLYAVRARLNLDAQAYLAMTLNLIRPDDPRIEVLRSDLVSAAHVSATGTQWEEDYRDYWNWSTDTRTTAIILAALVQIEPDSDLLPNAVRWLITQRETSAWESTQETAWAIMALTDWMVATGELHPDYRYGATLNGAEIGAATVTTDDAGETFTLVAQVTDMLIGEHNDLTLETSDGDGMLYYTAHLRSLLPVPAIDAWDRGIVVQRRYVYPANGDSESSALTSITEARIGDVIEVHLTVIAPTNLHYVVVEDPLPAGMEAINANLTTSQHIGTQTSIRRTDSLNRGWGWWWFNHIEFRDEKVVLYSSYLPAGSYEYVYFMRAGTAGTFNVIPATAQEFYFPEVYGRSDGLLFTITDN